MDKDFLLHNHNTAIKIMKLALLQNYHPVLRLHSSFTNCFSYVLYRKGLVQNHMYLVAMPL